MPTSSASLLHCIHSSSSLSLHLLFLLLSAIRFNGPIQLCFCIREILLVTVVEAELGPKHLLELTQNFPAIQLCSSMTVICK